MRGDAFEMVSNAPKLTSQADSLFRASLHGRAVAALIGGLGCRFDRMFGIFKTGSCKWRRMDLIFVPHEELAFGQLGWTGAKQFLRFMRAHAGDRGMLLNSHGSVPDATFLMINGKQLSSMRQAPAAAATCSFPNGLTSLFWLQLTGYWSSLQGICRWGPDAIAASLQDCRHTMRFGSTAEVLAECKLKY